MAAKNGKAQSENIQQQAESSIIKRGMSRILHLEKLAKMFQYGRMQSVLTFSSFTILV